MRGLEVAMSSKEERHGRIDQLREGETDPIAGDQPIGAAIALAL
jgi:hypothetical protein